MRKVKIDAITADNITICTLRDYRKTLKQELKAYKKGEWMHPEDVGPTMRKIEILTEILKDFGYDSV